MPLKVFDHAQFCFKLLASRILSKQASSAAAQLLHAGRTEHALPPCYRHRERLLYKPASYRAATCPQRGHQGHFSRPRRAPRTAAAAAAAAGSGPCSGRSAEPRAGRLCAGGRAHAQPSGRTVALQVTTLLASTAHISLWRVTLFFPHAF